MGVGAWVYVQDHDGPGALFDAGDETQPGRASPTGRDYPVKGCGRPTPVEGWHPQRRVGGVPTLQGSTSTELWRRGLG
jgi:hypothetical protein